MSRPQPRSQRVDCSDDEWRQRVDLAACYRAFVHYGWTDSIFTHLDDSRLFSRINVAISTDLPSRTNKCTWS